MTREEGGERRRKGVDFISARRGAEEKVMSVTTEGRKQKKVLILGKTAREKNQTSEVRWRGRGKKKANLQRGRKS